MKLKIHNLFVQKSRYSDLNHYLSFNDLFLIHHQAGRELVAFYEFDERQFDFEDVKTWSKWEVHINHHYGDDLIEYFHKNIRMIESWSWDML